MCVKWGFGMKNAGKRQYILTLIVSFVAIVVLSLCTIMTFYRKSVNDTLALAAETVKQEQEYMNSYLNRAVDAVEVTKITVEHMMREGRPEQDILNFLTNESDYYLQDIDRIHRRIWLYKRRIPGWYRLGSRR